VFLSGHHRIVAAAATSLLRFGMRCRFLIVASTIPDRRRVVAQHIGDPLAPLIGKQQVLPTLS
jgi:hypothetical protein